MPLPQTLKARHLTQLQHPNPIIRQRPLQLQHLLRPLRRRKYAQYLPVDLEAIEQVGEVGEVGGGGVFAVDVEPDEAFGADGAAEYFCEVEGVDVGEAGADEGEGGFEVGVGEGAAGVVGGGDVDGGEGDGFGAVGGGGVDWH